VRVIYLFDIFSLIISIIGPVLKKLKAKQAIFFHLLSTLLFFLAFPALPVGKGNAN